MCPFFITKQGKSIFILLTNVKTDPLSIKLKNSVF